VADIHRRVVEVMRAKRGHIPSAEHLAREHASVLSVAQRRAQMVGPSWLRMTTERQATVHEEPVGAVRRECCGTAKTG
jgi:hypothetical protein